MNRTLPFALAAAALAGAVGAQTIINSDITTSTTWTPAGNPYRLQQQIYVRNGATLTIQAGVVIASPAGVGGSLAVARGSQIQALGTERSPIVFTSDADNGTWREAVNEWGNLTIMGNAYISACVPNANTPTPNANNVSPMEGLIAAAPNDPNVIYGGGNDDDDSGTLSYVSFRFGGRVIGLGNELNGLSLGGIGRETDIHHVEIMNNIDDGVEIWGGTVNLKYLSIWNIGDDSIDIDQGWRGKIQYALVVQGYSVASGGSSGSGVCDNVIEVDGAEGADYQPVTTGVICNGTFIGQPNGNGGDHAMAMRDNARLQVRQSIFMDIGKNIVIPESGDHTCGGVGYGFNGTLSWAATWATPYTAFSTVNAPGNPAAFYRAQSAGNLNDIEDSVFFNNLAAAAYTEATNVGVFAGANNNVQEPATMPIVAITRAPNVTRGGRVMQRVTSLDPRPAADALRSVSFCPNDGFFDSVCYRGAFGPGANWLCGWTASSRFGFTANDGWCDLGKPTPPPGTFAPQLSGAGTFANGSPTTLTVRCAPANAPTVFVIGSGRLNLPVFGGTLVPTPDILVQLNANASGDVSFGFPYPAGVPSGTSLYFQAISVTPAPPFPLSFSNAVSGTKP